MAPADGSVPLADPVPSSCTSAPSGVVYGPSASAVGRHSGGTASLNVGTVSNPVVEAVPRPRPAKADQMRHRLVPPPAASVASSPSRALMKVGFCTVDFIPSRTRSAIAWTPPGICARMSYRTVAQIWPLP